MIDIVIDGTTVLVALFALIGLWLQGRRFDQVHQQDRTEAREDAQAAAARANTERLITQVETFRDLINGVIADQQLELQHPGPERAARRQEQLQAATLAVTLARAAATSLGVRTLDRPIQDLMNVHYDLSDFAAAHDDPVPVNDDETMKFFERTENAIVAIAEVLGELRVKSASA